MRLFRILLSLFIILGLLFALPALVNLSQQTTRTISRATDVPANILIEAQTVVGQLPKSFRALSQGGEEPTRMFAAVINEVSQLSPLYIRIDHIYDFFEVVKKQDGGLVFDFSQLDVVVEDILATGALPFLSLSYMPTVLSSDGTIIGYPQNLEEWRSLVQATIERYSGKSGKNLSGVYYEVWNEPDLFGRFTIGGNKDYRQLYEYAAAGAAGAKDTKQFFFGGPATTGPLPTWITGLLELAREKNLRLDFISYHRYSANPSVYEKDAESVRKIALSSPRFATIPLVLSEWGPNSEIDSWYDTQAAAAFTIATIRKIMDKVSLIMPFEVKDGISPSGQEYWGRWGVLTHEKFGKHPKPRYHALKLLNSLKGERLSLTGEGTNVSAIAVRDGEKMDVLLVNYDQAGKNSEAVPIKIKGLSAKAYSFKERDLTTEVSSSTERVVNGELTKSILMPTFAIKLLEFRPLADESSYLPGKSGTPGDLALILDGKHPKLEFSPPQFNLKGGAIEFSLQPAFLERSDTTSLFQLPIVSETGLRQEFAAKKQNVGFSSKLFFGTFENNVPKQTVSVSISDWKSGEWHDLGFKWNSEGLSLRIDGKVVDELKAPFSLGLGTVLSFEANGSAIDNLRITDGLRALTTRTFDGAIDR